MQLVFEDKQKRIIREREEARFSSFSSFHLVVVTARAKSEKQISKDATDDEELTVKIDGKTFPKIGSKGALLDSPASFNGGKLHNLAKTVYFLTFLEGKNHTITLETDKPTNAATLESVEVYTLALPGHLTLKVENQAEDGDGRPWVTFALDNFSLTSLTPTITYSRRERDSDDVKIIIDGRVQGNVLRRIKHFLWRYAGSLLPWVGNTKTETETFIVDLPKRLHHVEFYADRTPVLRNILIDLGKRPQPPVRIPMVDDPKWTGDLYDDPEDVLLARLIFGESRDQPKEAKAGVAWTVKNRLLAKRSDWGFSYHDVIQQPGQYAAFDPHDDNFPKLTDPFNTGEVGAREAWHGSYEVAQGVIKGTIKDPADGAVFFHSADYSQEKFTTEDVPGAVFIKQIGTILFYKK